MNSLSEQARIDATRYAEAELEKARAVLTEARQAMTAFRVRTRIVDPTVDLEAQMTVMTGLQGQLAEAQVALDTLRQNARPQDQRVIQAERKVAALQAQIEAERDKFGDSSTEGENYADRGRHPTEDALLHRLHSGSGWWCQTGLRWHRRRASCRAQTRPAA